MEVKYKILLLISKFIKWATPEEYEIIIGLKQLKSNIRKAKTKYWLALSPEKITENSLLTESTKYQIVYWVNYGDNNTYGWFTVEQIIKWLTSDIELYTLGGTKER